MTKLVQALILWLFRTSGWTVEGSIPDDIKKAVLVGGGHTSNWDLFGTLGLMTTLRKKFYFLIKKEAIRFPLKTILLKLGAIPVERAKPGGTNTVEQVAHFINNKSDGYICIAPEGTRTRTNQWKSGCLHIAQLAKIPIILCYLDYPQKKVVIGKVIHPKGTPQDFIAEIKDYFRRARPIRPENFSTD